MSRDLIQKLLKDIVTATEHLLNSDPMDLLSLGDSGSTGDMLKAAQRMGKGSEKEKEEDGGPEHKQRLKDKQKRFHSSVC